MGGVMLVPKLGVNLIALNRLMMDGIKVSNSSRTLTLARSDGKKLVDLELAPTIALEAHPPCSSLPSALAADADAMTLHGRLGRPSDERLRWLLSRSGGPELTTSPSASCDVCVLAKATQTGVTKKSS